MSLDYPFYEDLCRRKHRAAWWWLIGDRLYYLGLVSAVLSISGAFAGLLAGLLDRGWSSLVLAAVTFPIGVVVFFVGASFKRRSYRLAKRDGIEARW